VDFDMGGRVLYPPWIEAQYVLLVEEEHVFRENLITESLNVIR
jgi:hypothetical protein